MRISDLCIPSIWTEKSVSNCEQLTSTGTPLFDISCDENRGKQFCMVDQFLFTIIPSMKPFKEAVALRDCSYSLTTIDQHCQTKMISISTVSFALCFVLLPIVDSITFDSFGIGAGKASAQRGVFGISTVVGNGNFAGIGTAASSSSVSGSTSVISPVKVTESEEISVPTGGSEEGSNTDISSLLERGLQAEVPDYRDASVPTGKTYTTGKSGNQKPKSAEKASEESRANIHRTKVCWTMSKQCCYEEVQKGYECKDFYEYKYARCHPVIDYEQVCGGIRERPAQHPRPKGRVKYEESVLKNYDARYGPHVAGYPERGESEYYRTDNIPNKPHGVSGTPYPAPQSYQAGSVSAESGEYDSRRSDGNTISVTPHEMKDNTQTAGTGSPQRPEQKPTQPMKKTTGSAATGAGGTYEMDGKPEQSYGKTSKPNSESKTGANGPGTPDQAQTSYATSAAPAPTAQESGSSYPMTEGV
eukprot:TRINITY_DN17764_c0_g1_i1.p1 TRINITY_DN17764_c0_g1~~TRINITY_DN17764_c0_g1_i1.p1  ORF type:complete len:473 (-),score=48.36 TRINITY_DN17764_c0_g1_i1:963-2381(-)